MRWLFWIALVCTPAAWAADDRPDRPVGQKLQGRINTAIQEGVRFLKSAQSPDGSWKYAKGPATATLHTTGGLTALALYAMAASGVRSTDQAIERGVRWTQSHKEPFKPQSGFGTYSASLLVLALTRIDARKHKNRIHQLAGRLVKSQLDSGMWSYPLRGYAGSTRRPPPGRVGGRGAGDNSNSQFAILALWAAHALTSYPVPKKTWTRVRDLYAGTQNPDGTWPYRGGFRGRGRGTGPPSMTAAGLVAYVYAVSALTRKPEAARQARIARKGLKALLSGPRNYLDYYFAYAMERAGTVMAIPLPVWYVPGATELVKEQKKDGSWMPRGFSHGDRGGVYTTSLALLFLSRKTLPPRVSTKRETFPDLSRPNQLGRGFDFYHAYKPEGRAGVLHEFKKAGPAAVGLFIRKLGDSKEAVRVTAFELLTKLVAKRFFFDPRAPLEERAVMLVPIESFWKLNRASLRWNEEQKRFVRPR